MQLHVPDPAYTSSEHAQANFRLALKIALAFVALLWLIQLLGERRRSGLGRLAYAGTDILA